MSPVKKEISLVAPLPISPLSPHMQEILDKELNKTEHKVQQVFVPTIGGKWKIKK